MKLIVSSKFGPLASFLRADAPAGVSIEAPPIVEQRGDLFGIPVTVNVSIIVNIAEISVVAAAAWLGNKLINLRAQNLETCVNNKPLPGDHGGAEKLIAQEIENQKAQNNEKK